MSPNETERFGAAAGILGRCGYGLVVVAWMLADLVPRFFQGDSISYLMTGEGWIPPDRSWAYGFAANFLLRHTHGYSAIMLLQIGVLACLIASTRVFFWDLGRSTVVYGGVAVLLGLDPLLEICTRFLMSDFAALAAYFTGLVALLLLLCQGAPTRRLCLMAALFIASAVAAVFVRVAYALIIEITVLLTAAIMCDRLTRRQWLALAVAALGPVVAVGSLAVANQGVFGDRFGHELFVNKMSGVFLASVFAPALQRADFERVGIPATDSEFLRLDLTNYGKRAAQPFAKTPDYLHQFLKDKLGIRDDYTTAVDKAASALVWSALERNPVALAQVYVRTALDYANPLEWRDKVYGDMGLSRALPTDFVAFSNGYSVLKIDPTITQTRSPLLRAYEAISYLYPLQLLLGLAAAAYLMMWQRGRPSVAVLSAALLADLASAPLYSQSLVARYLLGSVFVSYLLIGLAIQSMMIRRQTSTPQPHPS